MIESRITVLNSLKILKSNFASHLYENVFIFYKIMISPCRFVIIEILLRKYCYAFLIVEVFLKFKGVKRKF